MSDAREILKSLRAESPMGFAIAMLACNETHQASAVTTDCVFEVLNDELNSEE